MKRFLSYIALICLCSLSAWAQPGVFVSVEKTRVHVEEPFVITVHARGVSVGEPVLPHSDEVRFDPNSVFNSTSLRSEFYQGRSYTVRERQWGYHAWALKPGTVKFPQIAVTIDAKTYLSKELFLTVAESAKISNTRQGFGQPSGVAPNPPVQPTLDDVVIIESEVSSPRVYQGEELVLQLRIWTLQYQGIQASYTGGGSIALPSSEGFYAGPIREETAIRERNGLRYEVREISQPLYATGAGDFKIGAWEWEGTVRGYNLQGAQRKHLSLATRPIPIVVRTLPDRPDVFSGAVGRFRVQSRLLQGEVVQGAPTQLAVQVSGRGNPDAIGAPELPEIPWAQVSGPEMDSRYQEGSEGFSVEKTFVYTITALEAGNQQIPELAFCYFAPQLGNYKTERTRAFSVFVKPSTENNQLVVRGGSQSGQRIARSGRSDLMDPIAFSAQRLYPSGLSPSLIALGLLAPPLIFFLFLWRIRHQQRLRDDTPYARKYHALRRGRDRIAALDEADSAGEALFKAITGFLADSYTLNEDGLTAQDARRVMAEAGVEERRIQGLYRILRACERVGYGGQQLRVEEIRAMSAAALEAMQAIDANWRKGRGA